MKSNEKKSKASQERIEKLSEDRKQLLEAMLAAEEAQGASASSDSASSESASVSSASSASSAEPSQTEATGKINQSLGQPISSDIFKGNSTEAWGNPFQPKTEGNAETTEAKADSQSSPFGAPGANPWGGFFAGNAGNPGAPGANPWGGFFAGNAGNPGAPGANPWAEWLKGLGAAQPGQPSGFEGSGAGGNLPPLSPLIAMKPSGSRPPFFCVHAIFGSAFPYFRLAMRMENDQPFYGLQSPGLDGKSSPLETIEEMAALYLELMRSVQAKGPYYLGGYSFGGWVALEMAQQLRKSGEEVGLLAMFGTSLPPAMSAPLAFEQAEYARKFQADYQRLMTNSFMADSQRVNAPPEASALPPLAKVWQANNEAQYRYLPRAYGGKMTVFLTSEQQAIFHPDLSLGWKVLNVQDVETHQVAGNHLSLFEEPHVQDLAQKLTLCLKAVQKSFGER